MSALSRRNFLALTGGAAVAGLAQQADAAMGSNDKFDLVIKGGDVLDPSQSLGVSAISASAGAWSSRSSRRLRLRVP